MSSNKTKWYEDSRFGMFIHWGLYSLIGVDEWIKSINHMSDEDYDRLVGKFTADQFDADEWAAAAKQAGMKYAVFTAKHHDGFCMYDSQLTDYKSTNSPAGRDFVREFLDAFRKAGIKVGLYYSLLDWHHPDYPHYGDINHPQRNNLAAKGVERDFQRYLDYMHGQIKELLTNYGQLDIMWFDFSYPKMAGETWQPQKIMDMIHQYQPQMLIDNRMEGSGANYGTILSAHPSNYAGDFASPEQMIPPKPIVNELGEPVPWEACITMNKHWGYNATDDQFKSTSLIIHTLVECVSKGGNLILNVGPTPLGTFSAPTKKLLAEIGEWMAVNGESVYGCTTAELEKPEWGRYTQKGNTLYAHIQEESISAFPIAVPKERIKQMTLLIDGIEVKATDYWALSAFKEYSYIFLHQDVTIGYPLPDPKDTVVRIELT